MIKINHIDNHPHKMEVNHIYMGYKAPIPILLILLITISIPMDVPAQPLRIAIVPFENRTGYTRLDYLGNLSFNLIVSRLSEYQGIDLFERQRPDLINKERGLSSGEEGGIKPSAPVAAIISGEFMKGDGSEKKIRLTVTRLDRKDAGTEIYERVLPAFDLDPLLSALDDLLREGIIEPNVLKKKNAQSREGEISGTEVAVIGFNNYSSAKEYDPLQKGIIYLMEERLGREQNLKVVERDQLKGILAEHALSVLSGENGLAFNLIPADLLVAGCFTFHDHTFRIDSRIINVHTTEIERAFHYQAGPDEVLDTSIKMIEDIAQALSESRKGEKPAAAIYPHSEEALLYFARGADLYDQGEYAGAVENINRALSVDPEYIFGRWEVARIYEERLGRYDKALEAYQKVLEQSGDETIKEKALLRLAMINYRYRKDYKQAVEYFSQFLNEFPDSEFNDVILYSLGHANQQLGKYEQALEYYHRDIEDNPFSPLQGNLLLRAGQCYYLTGDHINARKCLEKACSRYGDEIFQAEKDKKEITVKEAAGEYLSHLQGTPR